MKRRLSGPGEQACRPWFRVFLTFALVLGVLAYDSTSLAQSVVSISGSPNQRGALSRPDFKPPAATSQKDDGPVRFPAAPAVKRGTPAPGGDAGGLSSEQSPAYTPLWQRLADLAPSDRENARIQVEPDSHCSPADLGLMGQAQGLWNSGNFDAAIDLLRSLESAGVKFALGISWQRPRATAAMPPAATNAAPFHPSGNVRIGARTDIEKTELDFDAQNGNLFAVLQYYDSINAYWHWSVNISTNNGSSWQETFQYLSTTAIQDIGAAVVGDYLYIAYCATNDARIRRSYVSDGSSDTAFFYKSVFNKGIAIRNVSLVSNADNFDNRLYYLAVLENNGLIFYWAYDVNEATPTWTEIGTGVTNAGTGLDATWNKNYPSGYIIYASYIASDGTHPVMVARCDTYGTWAPVQAYSSYTGSSAGTTSVSAHNDTVICAFTHSYTEGMGIRYVISYSGGGLGYSVGSFPPPAGHAYYFPNVTARGGKGTAMVFCDEAGAFDPVWFAFRAGYQPGSWQPLVQTNQFDAATAYMTRIQLLPGGGNSYGAIFISWDPDAGTPYFTRVSNLGAVAPWLMLLLF